MPQMSPLNWLMMMIIILIIYMMILSINYFNYFQFNFKYKMNFVNKWIWKW